MAIVNNFHQIYSATQEQCLEPFVASYFKGTSKHEREELQKDLSAKLNDHKKRTLLENRIDSVPQSFQNEMVNLIKDVGKIEDGAKIKNDFRNRKLWFIGGIISLIAAIALVALAIFMPLLAPALTLGSAAFLIGAIAFCSVSASKHVQYQRQIDLIAKTTINGIVFLAQFSTKTDDTTKETHSTLSKAVNMKKLLTDKAQMIGKSLPNYLDMQINRFTSYS